jgi:hypothetical protein
MTEINSNTVLFPELARMARSNIAPPLDIWSNEGGGRALFEQEKAGTEASIAKLRAGLPAEKEGTDRMAREAKEAYDRAKTAYVEKYGSEQLANLELTLKNRNDGDSFTLSPEAKAFLRDAQELRRLEKFSEAAASWAISNPKHREVGVQFSEYVNAVSTATYESRFNKDPQRRLEALRDLDQLWNGPKSFANIHAQHKRDLDQLLNGPKNFDDNLAQDKAGTSTTTPVETPTVLAPSALEIPDERKLFKIDPSDNSVKLDVKALAKLTPDQMALEQLKKLADSLRKQSETDDLRDALNRALTERTAELAAS